MSVVVVAAGICGLSACGGGGIERKLSADHEVFRGLDAAIVDETVSYPQLAADYSHRDDEKVATQLVQARAYDLMSCRQGYETYRRWRTTGVPGELPPLPKPPVKVTEGFTTINEEHEKRMQLLAANDIEGFKRSMHGSLTCGKVVPVKPKDYNGQTIEQALQAEKPEADK